MTREELCWLAGWLEGEGCFFWGLVKGRNPRLSIQAFSTDFDVLQKVGALLDAPSIIRMKPRHRSNGGYRVTVEGECAAQLMRELLPLMGQRRSAKIRDILEKWDTRATRPMKKLCACGCGREIFGGIRLIYARRETNACAMSAFRARQKRMAA